MPDESKENQKTLKGGISYYTYIWRTEPGACDTCEELDGTEYTSVDDIPNKPHPNCKCYIDVIENNEDEDEEENDNDEENNINEEYSENDNSNYDNESDDDRKEYYDLTDEAIGDCDSLIDEIQTAIDEFKNQLSDNYFENVKDKTEENIEQLRDYLNELFNISFLLKDLYFNIQEIELQEIKRQLDNINYKINSIKNTVQEIYNNAKSEIESFINNSKEKFEEKIKEFRTESKLKDINNFENNVKNWENKINYSRTPIFGKIGLSIFGGPDSAGMLNLAESKYVPLYTKDAIQLNSISDIANVQNSLAKFKPNIEKKIKEQFKDYNYDINSINGFVFKNTSAAVQRIKESDEFKKIINKNVEKLMKGERFSGTFINDENLHNAFGKVDFLNSGIDKQGNLHLYMLDTYDFNKNESPKIEAGRRQMSKGNLRGFFTIHEIVIPPEYYGQYGVEG